jgi:hypothetical protein
MNQTVNVSPYELAEAKKMRDVLDQLRNWHSGQPAFHADLYGRLREEHSWYRPNSGNYVLDLPRREVLVRYGWQEILNGLARGYTQEQLWAMSDEAIQDVFPALAVATALKANKDYTLDEAHAYAALRKMADAPRTWSIDLTNL